MKKANKETLIGQKAPDFSLSNQNKEIISLKHLIKEYKYIVLYFYPKDLTPGCTTEAIGFSKLQEEFEKLGAKILGVSKDSPEKHSKFIEKKNLKIDLLSDENLEVLKKYGVWVEKSMFGRKYMGISRETFLIDKNGNIIKHWQKVKPLIHPKEVLEFIESL